MNRYLVFAFDTQYPLGGWNDFQDSYDDLEDAIEKANELISDSYGICVYGWSQVVDSRVGSIVHRNNR